MTEDRKRRPNQLKWLETRTLPGLTAPVLDGSSFHPKALVISNATFSLIMW